jgi:uncharacterized membrane protein YhaH (DUF805 family)/glutaredoxin
MTQRYRVVLAGEILPGHDPEKVRAALERAFRLDAAQLDRVLSGRRLTVKQNVSAEEAEALAARICKLGVLAKPEFMPPDLSAAIPAVKPEPLREPASAKPGSDEMFSLAPPPAAPAEAPPPDDSVTCPQCGEVQPKRTLCRKCGLDMPRHHAAKAEVEREARAERAAVREPARAIRTGRNEAVTSDADEGAALLSFGFSGRLGRLGYLAGSFLSSAALFLAVSLSLMTGSKLFAGLGAILMTIYAFRCAALRLHDTGRTGWLSLLLVVPIIGGLFSLALCFIPGDGGENDHGPAPSVGRGGAVLLGLLAVFLCFPLMVNQVIRNPLEFQKIAQAIGQQGPSRAAVNRAEDAADPDSRVRYGADNHVVMYSQDGCEECDRMHAWLSAQGFRLIDHRLDGDEQAIERLQAKLEAAGYANRQVQLPVVEVNGKLLPNNPSRAQVRRYLNPEHEY